MASTDPGYRLKVADLVKTRYQPFDIQLDAAQRNRLSEEFGLLGLKKFRLEGTVEPMGRGDWKLTARLGATVVQPCVVTLAPVTSRIDEAVGRLFLVEPPEALEGETEVPEDDSVEALGDIIDLWAVATESLALALPIYPRADGVELEDAQFAEPGVAPLTDEETKPFAGLAELRGSLGKNGS